MASIIVVIALGLAVYCRGALISQRKVVLRQGANKTSTAHLELELSQEQGDYGDAACMRWSGGTCNLFACHPERGPTSCVDKLCMCAQGYCADAQGKCKPAQRQQEKLMGKYAIRFLDAYKPYMTVTTDDMLVTTEDSHAQWKLFRSPDGFVRFESALRPGSLLGMYASGDMSLQTDLKTFNTKEPKPTRQYMLPAPTESGFRLYEIPGKGFEIYHPVQKASVAGSSSYDNVGQCYYWWWVYFKRCSGQEVVTFEPHLAPGIAVLGEKAAAGNVVPKLNWMQYSLLVFVVLALAAILKLICDKMGWNLSGY